MLNHLTDKDWMFVSEMTVVRFQLKPNESFTPCFIGLYNERLLANVSFYTVLSTATAYNSAKLLPHNINNNIYQLLTLHSLTERQSVLTCTQNIV